jgi:hypothetical protein
MRFTSRSLSGGHQGLATNIDDRVSIMPSFFFAPLCIVLSSLLLLFCFKAFLKGSLPSNGNILKANSAFLVLCAGLYVGMLSERYLPVSVVAWAAKILPICGVVLFILIFCKELTPRELGLCCPRPAKILLTLFLTILLGAMTWGAVRYFSFHQSFSMNRFIFMLTISGVDEELVFRGMMPSLLRVGGKLRDRETTLNRVIVFAVPAVIFTLIHALRFVDSHFSFSGYTFVVIGSGACAFMYLRLKTDSILNSIIVHNVLNAGTVVVLAIGESRPL